MRTSLPALLLAGMISIACGPRAPASSKPSPDPGGAVTPHDAGATVAPDPGVPDQAPLTEEECARMINHMIDIGLDEQRRDKKPEEVPTEEQVAKIRANMVRAQLPECMRYDRASWRCAMNAANREQLEQCAAEPAPER